MDRQSRKKAKILDSVLLCKREDPYREPQLTQIAAKADISVRTLNRYYPNKDEMFCRAYSRFLKQEYDEAIANFEDMDLSGLNGYEQLLEFFENPRLLHHDQPDEVLMTALAYIKCIQYGLKNPEKYESIAQSSRAIVNRLLKKGQQDHSIRADLDIDMTVDMIDAGFNGLMQKIAMTCCQGLTEAEKARALLLGGEFMKMIKWYIQADFFTPNCLSTDKCKF